MSMPLPNTTTAKDMELVGGLTGCIGSAATFPLTYTYDGMTYRGLPAGTNKAYRFVDANLVETVYTGTVPGSDVALRVECLTYRDYPVVEWTAYFTNPGSGNSGMLQDVWAIDLSFPGKGAVLTHNNGDYYSAEGYTNSTFALVPGSQFRQAPTQGRPCNEAWPYQRVTFDGFGLNLSIGWPGQWACEYAGTADGITFKAGQQTVHTYLKSGETLRTPRMTVMAFEGGEARGINVWRRWMNAHVTPKSKGDIVQPIAVTADNGGGIEMQEVTETNQLEGIEYFRSLDFGPQTVWWIDAGWYPCYTAPEKKEWQTTGTWEPDRSHLPRGLAPIGAALKDAGMGFVLWFEPERVRPDTWLAQRHPEWMLHARPGHPKEDRVNEKNMMLNLADRACLDWLSQHYSTLIKESGVTIYRQDFNFAPLPYWRDNEAEDRKGMLKNQYLQNYLAFWDYLLMDNPNLWIDSCASGGRRNDLETMRRSVPLHPTDYGYGYHHINQAFRHTLHAWIPYTRSWTGSWDKDNQYYSHENYYAPEAPSFDNFKMINGFGALTSAGGVAELKALPDSIPYVRKLLAIWREFADIQFRGDFYPLTENHRDFTRWTVFQFAQPEKGIGAFQVLRNNQSQEETKTVRPQGFSSERTYTFENKETGETFVKTGAEIESEGLTFTLPVRAGAIWFYRTDN